MQALHIAEFLLFFYCCQIQNVSFDCYKAMRDTNPLSRDRKA